MNETKSIEREKVTSDRLVANAITEEIIQQLIQLFPTAEADYESHIVTPNYWLWAAQQIKENHTIWDVAKLHRWIGWIQGMLNGCGITSLDEERDRVRQIKAKFE